jgi:hypothetical protein
MSEDRIIALSTAICNRREKLLSLSSRIYAPFKETRMKERSHKYEVELSEEQRFALQ